MSFLIDNKLNNHKYYCNNIATNFIHKYYTVI